MFQQFLMEKHKAESATLLLDLLQRLLLRLATTHNIVKEKR